MLKDGYDATTAHLCFEVQYVAVASAALCWLLLSLPE